MKKADLLRAAIVCFVLSTLGAMVSSAQTFQTLVNFNGPNGRQPSAPSPMVLGPNGDIYGATTFGGTGIGTVFQITPSGSFSTLYDFCGQSCASEPTGVILGSDGSFYGTTQVGGAYSRGTAFQLTPSGTLSVLYNFCALASCADGSYPGATLVQGSDGNFYGTTVYGGTSLYNVGTVFKLTPSGGLTTLHSFCSQGNCSDGEHPTVMLQASDGDFYGITLDGGSGGGGTVFKITPAGIFTTLYSFCCGNSNPQSLVLGSDGNFYGTTQGNVGQCANGNCGTVFQLTPSGTLTTLYTFCSLTNCADGELGGALVQGSDGNLYGTTFYGGSSRECVSGCGTFFKLTPGGILTTLYDFCRQCGTQPNNLLQTSDGTFYGTTFAGGNGNCNGNVACGTLWSWSPNVALAPTFTPASVSFGNQAVNTTSQPKSVTIKNVNTGIATLDFSNFTVSPPFAISSNTCGTTLPAGHTCHVSITFTPTSLGTASGTLSVADNAPGSPQTVPLSGTGIAQATVTPTSLAFGTVKVGSTSAAKKVTLKNDLPTTLTGISYSTQWPFEVSASTCGTTLASKQTCTISVTFSPTTIGPASGSLNVTDSANNSPQAVSLSGTGD